MNVCVPVTLELSSFYYPGIQSNNAGNAGNPIVLTSTEPGERDTPQSPGCVCESTNSGFQGISANQNHDSMLQKVFSSNRLTSHDTTLSY